MSLEGLDLVSRGGWLTVSSMETVESPGSGTAAISWAGHPAS